MHLNLKKSNFLYYIYFEYFGSHVDKISSILRFTSGLCENMNSNLHFDKNDN